MIEFNRLNNKDKLLVVLVVILLYEIMFIGGNGNWIYPPIILLSDKTINKFKQFIKVRCIKIKNYIKL